MKRRFQFSLRALMAAVTWFAASMPFFIYSEDDCTGIQVSVGLLLIGTAIEQLFGHPFRGFLAVIGLFAAIIILGQILAALSR